jgi:hypothetical protein
MGLNVGVQTRLVNLFKLGKSEDPGLEKVTILTTTRTKWKMSQRLLAASIPDTFYIVSIERA